MISITFENEVSYATKKLKTNLTTIILMMMMIIIIISHTLKMITAINDAHGL